MVCDLFKALSRGHNLMERTELPIGVCAWIRTRTDRSTATPACAWSTSEVEGSSAPKSSRISCHVMISSQPVIPIAMESHTPPITSTAMTVEARGVRFDDECILIPDPQPRSRMPKLLAKSSSFIFKRKLTHAHDFPSPTSPRDYDAPQSPPSPRPA